MKKFFKKYILSLLNKHGIDVLPYRPTDFDEQTLRIFSVVENYTMTGKERVNAVINAVNYLEANNIDGAMVECGVWKGGSTMAMALALKEAGNMNRDIYLYDTFSGMNAPTDDDIMYDGTSAHNKFSQTRISNDSSTWCAVPIDTVRQNVFNTGYPQDKFHFIQGVVEKTIPATLPEKIALLRLDTDWYESTKHELTHLFPLLAPNGIIIIDDYGHWQGARKAMDEYIRENHLTLFLHRIDYTGVIGVKSPMQH